MTSLIAGTWSIISSSAEVITGARRITYRIHRLLQPGLLELNDTDRCKLLGLQKRVECLVHPLNFLLLWSKNRDSCVQQIVLNAQELLFDVCSFVERFTPQDSSPQVPGRPKVSGQSGTIGSEQLDYYLRELEFACASVGMAISIANATQGGPQPALSLNDDFDKRGPVSNQSVGSGVSLSALLRASRCIQEMRGRSGDLCAFRGCLYSQVSSPRGTGILTPNGAADEKEPGCEWTTVMSLATFKVVAGAELHPRRRRYGITVESRLPLIQGEGGSPPLGPSHPAHLEEEPDASGGLGLNASGRLDFPIEVALDARLVTTGHMALQTGPGRCSKDVGVDSLAVLWPEPSASGSSSSAAWLPVDAVLVQDVPSAGRMQYACNGGGPVISSRRFAFVFDPFSAAGSPEGRSSESEVVFTPLDAVYLARLCALDDGHHSSFGFESSQEVGAGCPLHLQSSDEALAALLLQDDPMAASSAVANGLVRPAGPPVMRR